LDLNKIKKLRGGLQRGGGEGRGNDSLVIVAMEVGTINEAQVSIAQLIRFLPFM
jgi:hypothetical protein